jgi:DNA (cytosine-5)-methyltransferase 1
MRYLSVCSGIEAATVAWHHMGWEAVGYSEIEKFPSQVLAHHYPNVTNYGDMTKFKEWNIGTVDLLVGGTPCQSFSVAGLRKGLEDPRGNLALTYCAILDKFKPKWFVWENVPGVLSSGGGRDFGSFLGAVAQLGYGFAYRVLDAQYFGVAQRRKRVFVVGCFGNWRNAAKVLFEPESLCGDIKASRKNKKNDSTTINASIVYENHGTDSRIKQVKICPTVTSRWGTGGNNVPLVQQKKVRKLTCKETERLQGFPDNYTDIQLKGKPTPDGPRYKALGNSMAVPVMKWIGERINLVENIL